MVKIITSLQNPLVKHLVKLRQNRDYRYEHHALVVEGRKLVAELGQKGLLKTIVVCDPTLVPAGVKAEEVLVVNEDIMEKISGMHSPEGVLAEIAMPEPAALNKCHYLLVLDGINDPGNLGTLIRTALALGWEGVFLLNESCDPFNEKALRAARGAVFRLPLAWGSWKELKKIIEENQLTPVVADLEGQKLDDCKLPDKIALIMGNEAHGHSGIAKENSLAITIPMPGEMESLNVAIAGGIMMYALRKK